MKTWKIPVQWTMKSIVEVEAKTLREAMDKATIDDDNLLQGEFVPDSYEIYDDLDTWDIRKDYNYGQADEEEPPTRAEIEWQEKMARRDRWRNPLIVVCTVIAVVLLIAGMTWMFISDAREEERVTFLYENASTSAIITEKYTRGSAGSGAGTVFYVVAEHQSVTIDGEKTSFTRTYTMPWEDYIQIDVGDSIIAEHLPGSGSGYWRYISYEKATSDSK